MEPFEQPTLAIDASGPELFVGVAASGVWRATRGDATPPLESLFDTVSEALDAAATELADIRALVACSGPGSVLGLRLAAMALETWRRLIPAGPATFAYGSLELAAWTLSTGPAPADGPFCVISDWRRDRWNALRFADGRPGAVEAATADDVAALECPVFHIAQRKAWQAPPANATTVAYRPADILEQRAQPGLLAPVDRLEPAAVAPPEYRKWDARPHGREGTNDG